MAKKKSYGSRGQTWHPDFIQYMEEIAAHPGYAGMPDARTEDGRIQWEAPSNRKSGRFKDTHHKRRNWWRRKAQELGIRVDSPQWISRAAKTLHPTKRKPCKRCGRVMELAYVYPQARLLARITSLPKFDKNFKFAEFEPIDALLRRLVAHHGDAILDNLSSVFRTHGIAPPSLGRDLEAWLHWLRATYIVAEPPLLSPGAMSNAPDRFEGFHHFNLCCRGKADTGRHRTNLSSYVTDRRAFEYWNDGDWIAADRLMGVIRANLGKEPCLNGHAGPCNADHTGPLSLGFAHRPEFQLMCTPCNSGKNNRLSLRDVQKLRESEKQGERVVSWHSRAVWDSRKSSIVDDETALRMTKLLRDNRRTTMSILGDIASVGHLAFLASLLHLKLADSDVEILETKIKNSTVRVARMQRKNRETKYAAIQKARRVRIAFASLSTYTSKKRRNSFVVMTPKAEKHLSSALRMLERTSQSTKDLDRRVAKALGTSSDASLKQIVDELTNVDDPMFAAAFREIEAAMEAVGAELGTRWDDERYVRAERDETD